MPDIDALNDPELLSDTPIGDLEVIRWCGELSVAIKNRHDPERPGRIVHTLGSGGVLDAIYGKRFFEGAQVLEAYGRQAEIRQASAQRENDLRRQDFRRDFRKWLWRNDGGGLR